ncbi:SDR family oxidoreductase, partial [bacterium]|nr:SDR family oxidoreductase [bacterium]
MDLTNKVALVTGATDGIGKETALQLAKAGATVIVHGRNPSKIEETVAQIKKATGSERLDSVQADYTSLDEVRKMAEHIKASYPHIHLLINNAGLFQIKRNETKDGFETTFGVNHLAPFLLTNLLLDTVKASAPARIVNVASMLHKNSKLDFDNLQLNTGFKGGLAYANSKVANILFTRELARRLEGTGVTAYAIHPGGVATGIGGPKNIGIAGVFFVLAKPFMDSIEDGAKTTLYCATSPDLEGVSGRYYADSR